jgi:predicted HAD superfamily Cof-like phosphohydrolase
MNPLIEKWRKYAKYATTSADMEAEDGEDFAEGLFQGRADAYAECADDLARQSIPVESAISVAQQQVRHWEEAMGYKTTDNPVPLEEYNGDLRGDLITEESEEFWLAWENGNRADMIDALADILYVTLGAAVDMGVDLGPFWEEVCRSNMTKTIDPPTRREDGKYLKGERFTPPDISGVYERLYGEGI